MNNYITEYTNRIKQIMPLNKQFQELQNLVDSNIFSLVPTQEYYENLFIEKAISRFTAKKKMPETLPMRDIMLLLVLTGKCGIIEYKNNYYAVDAHPYGVTNSPYTWPAFEYATPIDDKEVASGMALIGKTGVLIRATSLCTPLMPMIRRYAYKLAQTDLTIQQELDNIKATNIFACSTADDAKQLKDILDDMHNGRTNALVLEMGTLGGNGLLDAIQSVTNIGNAAPTGRLKELVDTRESIFKDFWAEFGVKYSEEKRERMVVDEVQMNNQMLLFNTADATKCIQQGAEDMKKVFGLDVEFELAPEFAVLQNSYEDNPETTTIKEGEDNEN